MTHIVCCCNRLVAIEDGRIVPHQVKDSEEQCVASGLLHVSKRIHSGFPGGPSIEIIGAGLFECGDCGDQGIGVLLKIDGATNSGRN
jgi:hypothetical protein